MNRHPDPERSTSRRKIAALLLTGALAFIIGLLTLIPMIPPVEVGGGDKLHHLAAFAALVFPSTLLHRHALVWLAPAALLYGGGIELIRPYVGRHGEFLDFAADSAGVAIGIALGSSLRMVLATGRSQRGIATYEG